MATIQLDFKSSTRDPQHVDGHCLSRIEYVHECFLDAKKLAKPSSAAFVTGFVTQRDLNNIKNQFHIEPVALALAEHKGFYFVTFMINHDTIL